MCGEQAAPQYFQLAGAGLTQFTSITGLICLVNIKLSNILLTLEFQPWNSNEINSCSIGRNFWKYGILNITSSLNDANSLKEIEFSNISQ